MTLQPLKIAVEVRHYYTWQQSPAEMTME